MSSTEEINYLMTVDIDNARTNLRQIESLLMRTLSLMRRFTGGNEDLDSAIITIQRMITVARQLQMAMTMLMTGSPFGLLMGLVSLGTTAFMAQDTFEYTRRGL